MARIYRMQYDAMEKMKDKANEGTLSEIERAALNCVSFSPFEWQNRSPRATMRRFTLCTRLPSKFENMQPKQQQRQKQQQQQHHWQQWQPLPIYFQVEFDLNDNFFSTASEEKKRAHTHACMVYIYTLCLPLNAKSFVVHACYAHTLFVCCYYFPWITLDTSFQFD